MVQLPDGRNWGPWVTSGRNNIYPSDIRLQREWEISLFYDLATKQQLPEASISGDICKINGRLTLLLHLFLLCVLFLKNGIQTPIRWLFWDISLPSSGSADFSNKVTVPFYSLSQYLISWLFACHAANRPSLDLVTRSKVHFQFFSRSISIHKERP